MASGSPAEELIYRVVDANDWTTIGSSTWDNESEAAEFAAWARRIGYDPRIQRAVVQWKTLPSKRQDRPTTHRRISNALTVAEWEQEHQRFGAQNDG